MPRHAQLSSAPASRIREVRDLLDDLEVLLEARSCLQDSGRQESARRIPLQRELKDVLRSVEALIESCQDGSESGSFDDDCTVLTTADERKDRSSVRIQLKLSPDLVRVLQTVRRAHVKASELVETVLWESPRIRDTARLAGIRRPRRAPAA